MKKNEVNVVLWAIQNAKEALEQLDNPGYPHADFSSKETRDIFYTLNDCCLTLYKMRDAAEE